MKKILGLLFVVLVGFSCKFAAKEMKKIGKIRRAAKKVCNCSYVEVSSDYVPGSNTLSMTIKRPRSENHRNIADSVMVNVKKEFPNLCNHDEVYVIFEGDGFDEQFIYSGCDLNAYVDTIFYDYSEWEEFEEDLEEFEEFEEEAEVPPPPPAAQDIPEPIEEIIEEEDTEED